MSRYWNDFLMHYGVKGMKWGVRKDTDEYTSYRTERKTYRRMGEALQNNRNSETYKNYIAQKNKYGKLQEKLSDKYDDRMNKLLDKYDDGSRSIEEVDSIIDSDRRIKSIRQAMNEGENAVGKAAYEYMKESLDSQDFQKHADLGQAAFWDVENGRFKDELRSYRYAH